MEKNGFDGKNVRYEYSPQNSDVTPNNREEQSSSYEYQHSKNFHQSDVNSNSFSSADCENFQPQKKHRNRKARVTKIIVIILSVFLVVFGLSVACGNLSTSNSNGYLDEFDFGEDYVGVLYLEGTMVDGDSGDGYNQQWLLDRIQQMEDDNKNYGILLNVNTPGGDVYATDELYNKLLSYKENTGRPIYVYMENMAASGGYYASMAGDKVFANPNCWTGSIGVIVGTIYDFSGLMDKMGIKAVDITSGKNKAMGSSTQPLTEEQRAIYQSLVDEAFSNFVNVVMKGRNLSEEYVRQVADGRVYTAKQAKEAKLIDEISTLEEAQFAMLKEQNLTNCTFGTIQYIPETSLFEDLFGIKAQDLIQTNEYEELFSLIEKNSKFTVSYLSQVQK